jgi:Protein kinase domain
VPHSAPLAPLRRWDPEQVGGFTLLGRLGAGAMGQVYLGRSPAGRMVAVKTIKVEFAEEPDFRTRFAQEVAAARRVSGAFTAPVVAADPEADVPWLATAYVPAPALSTLVRACGPLSVPAVRWLAAGCAEALESIHGAGLVHRDLKPSNVLVSPDGPRVIDFGVTRAAERIALTVTRGAVGTPAYMAPEQARDTRHATAASDMYSLGATMLFAATGHAPYDGDTVMDVLVQLATAPPDLSGLPGDLAEIVTACLDRDPRRRPSSVAVLARLAPALAPGTGNGEYSAAVLPTAALALIDEYRANPGQAAPYDTDVGDRTFGSDPGRAAAQAPAALLSGGGSAAGQLPGQAGDGPDRPADPPGTAARRRSAVLVGSVLAAAALLAAGGVLGAYLDGRGTESASAGPSGSPTPAHASASTASSSSGAPHIAPSASTGPLTASSGSPQAGGPPPGFGPPPGGPPLGQDGKPGIVILQTYGDMYTEFVITGAGWPPRAALTVTLTGVGSSPVHPVVDLAGRFSYAINQGHDFFRSGLPPGYYHVVVTAPSGAKATAVFQVRSGR